MINIKGFSDQSYDYSFNKADANIFLNDFYPFPLADLEGRDKENEKYRNF